MLSKSAVDERKGGKEKGHGCMKTALGLVSCYREGAYEIFTSGVEINFSQRPYLSVCLWSAPSSLKRLFLFLPEGGALNRFWCVFVHFLLFNTLNWFIFSSVLAWVTLQLLICVYSVLPKIMSFISVRSRSQVFMTCFPSPLCVWPILSYFYLRLPWFYHILSSFAELHQLFPVKIITVRPKQAISKCEM